MRIIVATKSGSKVGGIETYISTIMPYLISKNHKVMMIVSSEKSQDLIKDLDISQISTKDFSLEQVLKEIRCFKPDIFFDNGIQEPILFSSLQALMPLFKFSHDYRDSCISGLKQTKRPNKNCKSKFGPMCLLKYFLMGCGGKSPLTMVKSYRKAKLNSETLFYFKKIFVASQWMFDEIANHGICRSKIVKIPYPPTINPNLYLPEEKELTGNVVFIGRIVEAKGWVDAIKAVKIAAKILNKKLLLHIVGGGPQESECRVICDKTTGVFFHGMLSAHEIRCLLKKSDVLLVPSRWPEPFGLVGLEAMGQGVPVVSYRTGGIGDWLVHGFNGLFSNESFSPESLGKALSEVLRDPAEWKKFSVNAYISSFEKTTEIHIDKLISELGS